MEDLSFRHPALLREIKRLLETYGEAKVKDEGTYLEEQQNKETDAVEFEVEVCLRGQSSI